MKRSGVSIGARSIEGILEACSSQTNITFFDSSVHAVENHLRQSALSNNHNLLALTARSSGRGLSAEGILAGMDYFFLVQHLPEDRKIVVRTTRGIVAIVVWAHYLLGLSVQVTDKHSRITLFGDCNGAPNVFIQETDFEPKAVEEWLLLDAESQIVLRCIRESHDLIIEALDQERHALLGLGTELVRRYFNEEYLIRDDDPVYLDLVSMVLAVALNASGKIRGEEPPMEETYFRGLAIEAWRVFDSATILFDGIQIRKEAPKAYLKKVQECGIDRSCLPDSVKRVAGQIASLYPKRPATSREDETCRHIAKLTLLTLTFAHVHNVAECTALPVSLHYLEDHILHYHSRILEELEGAQSNLTVVQDFFHEQILALVLGTLQFQGLTSARSFVISDFGWSVVLGCVNVVDPGDVRPSMVRICHGVPTHSMTGERKRFVCDGPPWGQAYPRKLVVDVGESYVPRSLARITQRKEFCASAENAFKVTVGLEMKYEGIGSMNSSLGYWELHRNLWRCLRTASCGCLVKAKERASLGFNAATVTGDPWEIEADMRDNKIEQRICIYLAQRHRTLWFQYTSESRDDFRIVIKSSDCCEDCALKAASALPNKVLLLV